MALVDLLTELGGVARRGALLRVVDRVELDRAVAAGDVVRDGRGRYALPDTDAAVRAAAQLGGVVSHTSAALAHGWAVKTVPTRPHVTVSRGRRLPAQRLNASLHVAELGRGDVVDGVTSVEVTLRDCVRHLPYDEALAVADSARREGVGAQLMQRLADEMRGPGSAQGRRVLLAASPRAANPFESVLRAICHDIPGLAVRPQIRITDGGFAVRPDLVDERLRIVAEADSFEWHGGRASLAADARRYNRLVVAGWIVLRFSYEDVMSDPGEVRDVLLAAVALAELLNKRMAGPRRSA